MDKIQVSYSSTEKTERFSCSNMEKTEVFLQRYRENSGFPKTGQDEQSARSLTHRRRPRESRTQEGARLLFVAVGAGARFLFAAGAGAPSARSLTHGGGPERSTHSKKAPHPNHTHTTKGGARR